MCRVVPRHEYLKNLSSAALLQVVISESVISYSWEAGSEAVNFRQAVVNIYRPSWLSS